MLFQNIKSPDQRLFLLLLGQASGHESGNHQVNIGRFFTGFQTFYDPVNVSAPIQKWGLVFQQLAILFEGRLKLGLDVEGAKG